MSRFGKTVIIFCLAVLLAVPAFAAPERELNAKNLAKFIADYGVIMLDFESIKDEVQSDIDPFSDESASGPNFDIAILKANLKKAADDPKIVALLKSHGWDEEFWDVLITVTFSALFIQIDELNAVQAVPQLQDYLVKLREQLHPDDVSLIRENEDAVNGIMGL